MTSSEDIKDEHKDTICLESPSLQDIKDAARNIASKAIKTPLVKLNQRSRNGSRNDSNVSVSSNSLNQFSIFHFTAK